VRGASERSSALLDRLPIRARLAGVSALLTFVILCAFAVAIGSVTVHRIRADFNRQVTEKGEQLRSQLKISVDPLRRVIVIRPGLAYFASPSEHAIVRVYTSAGKVIAQEPLQATQLGQPEEAAHTVHGYRVISRAVDVTEGGLLVGHVIVQYGRRVSDTEATVHWVEVLLLGGVLGGTALALLAGMAIARRAMAPIAELTSTAAEIARTRDPSRGVPKSAADDEVAELGRTLEGMLRELDAARGETEAMLLRQRQFVADASHELRTPLTSVLANLELLADRSEIGQLRGDLADAARSALRSSQRMRRLVADLLLLARSDVGRVVQRERLNLAQIVVEAAAELGPVSGEHDISLDVHPVTVEASRDELHRLTINLLENALRHTPPGTAIHVTTGVAADGSAELIVEDEGPGVAPELAARVFERFVRGSGDRGGSFGLGLSIVHAVAQSHGGSVALEPRAQGTGARFVVRLPARSDLDDDGQHHRPSLETVVD
jgi:signal transduction histidine kinase